MGNRDLMENSLGVNGFEVISDAGVAHAGKFCGLYFVNDTIISAGTWSPAPSGNPITGITIPAGTTLLGYCTSLTLTSGLVFAYKGE